VIKFLISFLIISIITSCKEFQNQEISNKINDSIKNIEKIIEKKDVEKNIVNANSKNTNNIFYYIGDPYFIEGVKYIPEENYNYSEIGLSTFYGKELHNVKTNK
jgi:hypothetical protein